MGFSTFFRKNCLRVAFGAVLAIVLYAVLVVYVLPIVLKPCLEEKLGAATASTVHIGKIKTYPFKLALTVHDFSAKNKTVKLTWDSLHINFQLLSIPTRSIRLDELRIHSLHTSLTLETEFTVSNFFKRMNVPLYIEYFTIQNGAFEGLDKRGEKEKRLGIAPISFSLEKFSTQYSAEHGNNYNLQFTGLNGGFFRWNGNLQWDPFLSQGEMEIRDLALEGLRDFYQEYLPFDLQNGKLDLHTSYRIVEEPEIGFVLENAQAILKQPVLLAYNSEFKMNAASIHTDSLQISTLSRTFFANNVIIDSANARWAFDSLPRPDPNFFEKNLPNWDINVNSLQTKQMNFEIADHNLNALQLSLTGITSQAKDSVNIAGVALLNGAELDLQGTARLFPLQAALNFNIKDFPLMSLQNYLSQKTWLSLRQGKTNTQLSMRWKPTVDSTRQDTLLFLGDAEINNLNLFGKNNGELVKARKTFIKGINAMLLPNIRLQANNVDVQAPVANLVWYENSGSNYSQIKKTENAKNIPTPFFINRVKFSDGTIHVTDKDPATPFSYRIAAVQGNLQNLSSQKRNADLFVQGKMGGYAPFSLNGSINLSEKHPKFDFTIESANQDLTAFSPYSGKFVGHSIAKGQVALQADYAIENNKVRGNNHVVMQHLTFGEAVENSEATKMPVRLFTALLSDKNGVIDLDVAIEGDLDDPTFSVGGLVWKVIKNLLGKAISAPFKSLMALVGSNSNPETIAFVLGSEHLDKEHLDVLKSLSQALAQRPQLQVDVHGNADPIQDIQALKEKLAADQELPPNALQHLAYTRAQNIKAELVNINPALGERIFVVNEGTLSEAVASLKIREY